MSSDLFAYIDPAEVARVCADLVRFETANPPGRERRAAEYVAAYLGPGFETTVLPYPDNSDRASVLCRLRATAEPRAPALVFSGHLDVVPLGAQSWRYPPFAGEIAEGQVWGRGASDMKSGLAAMLVAARVVATARGTMPLRGDLIVAATAGEEIGMTGAAQVAAWPDLGPLAAVVVGEPTDNTIGLAERGVLWVEFVTQGKTAHGSTPHLGRNALNMMRKLLDGVDNTPIPFARHPVLGDFSYSINTLQAGTITNVVPDRCVAGLDLRTVPGQDHKAILAEYTAIIDGIAGRDAGFAAQVSTVFDLPPVETPAGHPAVAQFERAVTLAVGRPAGQGVVRFATEAAVYVPALQVPAIIFGPGHPDLAHQPDEHAPIAKMYEAARVYAAAALEMLA